jgi:hypothetical protein
MTPRGIAKGRVQVKSDVLVQLSSLDPNVWTKWEIQVLVLVNSRLE